MLRIISILLLLVCAAAHADDMLLLGVGQKGGGSGSSYTGPGDIVSGATAFYGLRAYNAAYASGSNNAINVRRAIDNNTSDIKLLSSGALDVATAASFAGIDATASCSTTGSSTSLVCTGASSTPHSNDPISGTGITQPAYITSCGTFTGGAGTCTMNMVQNIGVAEAVTFQVALYVTKFYDQSGNGYDASQSTAALQGFLVFAGKNGNPVVCTGSAVDVIYNSSSTYPGNVPFSISYVAIRTGQFTQESDVINYGNYSAGFQSTANTILLGGIATTSAADSSWHSVQNVATNSIYLFDVDGTITSGSDTYNSGTLYSSIFSNSGRTVTICVGEIGVWSLQFNSTQYNGLHNNQSNYWGTP